jgi:predicted NBD/HSP70 family sugar kinase
MERGSTNRDVRITNRKVVVNTLFHNEPMTKQELVTKTGLSLPTINYILKDLTTQGLITQGEKLDSSGGRPASYIQPVFDSGYSIGINISKNCVRIALSDLAPKLLDKDKSYVTFEDTREYWIAVNILLKKFITENNVNLAKLLGISLSFTSAITINDTNVFYFNNDKMDQLDLIQIRNYFDYDIAFTDSSKMAGFAQIWGAMETEDIVYLTINETISGAIMSQRDVLNFSSKNAMFGHMNIEKNGRKCLCGKSGCLDAYCSTTALTILAGTTLDDFFDGLNGANPTYQAILDDYLTHLATAINDIRIIFDTDIVIGGEMSTYLQKYIDHLQKLLGKMNPFSDPGTYARIGKYGEYDAAVGAGLIHNNHRLSS